MYILNNFAKNIQENVVLDWNLKMLLCFIRAMILYLIVLIVMRFMGKREIGQLEPFELAISIMIADLACTPMANPGYPIYFGIIPILALLVMHFLISFISIKSIKLREFFSR